MTAAKEAALKAYKDCLEKLGYQKYPEGELTMKGKKNPMEDDDDDDQDGGDDDEGDDVSKQDNGSQAAAKPVLKEDGTLNLEAVPENMRPFMEIVSKEMVASKGRADAAEQRAVKLEKQLVDQAAASRKTELISKAAGFKNLDPVSTLTILELADAAGKEKFDAVTKGLEASDKQIAESKLFATIGSPVSKSAGGMTSDTMAQVEKTVEQIVQKSAESGVKITKEQAMTDYLMSHPELYAQEKSRREASHPSGA